jgi:hypothetical protein
VLTALIHGRNHRSETVDARAVGSSETIVRGAIECHSRAQLTPGPGELSATAVELRTVGSVAIRGEEQAAVSGAHDRLRGRAQIQTAGRASKADALVCGHLQPIRSVKPCLAGPLPQTGRDERIV